MNHPLLRPLLGLGLLCATLAIGSVRAGGEPDREPSSFSGPGHHTDRKALLIGVDGMQYEKLLDAIDAGMAPNIGSLQLGKSYIGGVAGTQTEALTNSGPGWATMLTGTWVDRHGVLDNEKHWRSQADSVFKQLKQAQPGRRTASIISWETINETFANDIRDGYIDVADACLDPCVADKVSHEIETGAHDFIFAHFGEPDRTGHNHGFSGNYQAAIEGVDRQVGQLLAALQRRRQAYPEEDWLVIVAPDHGRRLPAGYDHGAQTLAEKTTFVAINKPANAQLTIPVLDPIHAGMDGLYGYSAVTDIAPTVLAHLGVRADMTAHQMDGIPLIGQLGARQLAYTLNAQGNAVTLDWRLTGPHAGSQLLRILRNGEPIAVLVGEQQFIDRNLPAGQNDLNYTVFTQQVAASILVKRGGGGLR